MKSAPGLTEYPSDFAHIGLVVGGKKSLLLRRQGASVTPELVIVGMLVGTNRFVPKVEEAIWASPRIRRKRQSSKSPHPPGIRPESN